ncbi:hypothetical protein NSTCB13_06431 [Nostoc sp. DSM 114160]|jgi:hypothetical protein
MTYIGHTQQPEATRAAMQQALFEEPPPTLTQLAYRLGYKSYSPLTHKPWWHRSS